MGGAVPAHPKVRDGTSYHHAPTTEASDQTLRPGTAIITNRSPGRSCPMPDCVVDGRPTDAALCRSCLDEVMSELRRVAWLERQLTITLTRQARVGDRNGRRSSERPLPFHHGASVDLESLRDTLRMWAETIAELRDVTLDVAARPSALARWLMLWRDELARHPDAREFHEGILGLTRAAQRTIDRHPELRYLGPCDVCRNDLYARLHDSVIECRGDVPAEDEHDPPTRCTARYDIEQRRAWLLEQASDQLRTARQLSNELPWIAGITITAERIGMWARRGKLVEYLPHVRDPEGRAGAKRYRVGEVIEVARAMAVEQARRHSGAA